MCSPIELGKLPELGKLLKYLNENEQILNEDFQNILDVASTIFKTSVSYVSLFDNHYQYLVATKGYERKKIPLKDSICKLVLESGEECLIEDTRKHHLYKNEPQIVANKEIIFYAGFPIIIDQKVIGSFCLVDHKPRSLDKDTRKLLSKLKPLITRLLKVRLSQIHQIIKTKRLQDIIDSTEVGTWEWNVMTGELALNDRWMEIVGYQRKELEPINIDTWYKLLHPDDRNKSDQPLKACFEKKIEFYDVEVRMIHKDGHHVWINDRGKVTEWTADGKPLLMTGTHTDITQRKNAEIQFETISHNIPGVVFRYLMRADGTDSAQLVSDGVKNIYGLSKEEVIKDMNSIWNRVDKRDVQDLNDSVIESRDKLAYWDHEWRYHHPNGKIIWIKGTGNPTRLENGDTVWDSFLMDITGKKEAEEQLRESEKLLNEAQRYSKMGNWNFDFRKDKLTWSDALYDVFGIDKTGFNETHSSFLDLIIPEDREYARSTSIHSQKTGEPFTLKYRIITPTGEHRTIEEHGYSEKDKEGKIIRLFGIARDITELVNSKKEIQSITYQAQKSERKRIAEYLHDGLQQTLVATLMRLNMFKENYQSKPKLSNDIDSIRELLKEGINQTRSIAHELVPPEIESGGLIGALTQLVKKYEGTSFHMSFVNKISSRLQLPPDTEVLLYRIAQEGTNNILKHSKANKSTISLSEFNGLIKLTVEDNGVGFNIDNLTNRDFGLTHLTNRIESISGVMNISSTPDNGTVIDVSIPYDLL